MNESTYDRLYKVIITYKIANYCWGQNCKLCIKKLHKQVRLNVKVNKCHAACTREEENYFFCYFPQDWHKWKGDEEVGIDGPVKVYLCIGLLVF